MIYKNIKGETLIEVLAALTCLVLAGLSAVTVALQVMTTTATSKEYLIAQNLAREAIEGVINIRDTNWLNHPADKDECWLIRDSVLPCATQNNIQTNENYIIQRNSDGRLLLGTKGLATLDIPEDENPDTDDRKFILYVTNNNVYQHEDPATKADPYPTPDFYRMISFEEEGEKMWINVKIQWMHKGSIPKKYEVSSVITNYAD